MGEHWNNRCVNEWDVRRDVVEKHLGNRQAGGCREQTWKTSMS